VQVGECAYEQQGLEAMRRALTPPLVDHADAPGTPLANDGNLNFYRQTATLAVVAVSDDDDTSPDSVSTYVRFLQQLKGAGAAGRASLYAIVPSGETCPSASGQGVRYAEAASRTGGAIESICASDFAPLLQDVVGRAFSPQTRFPLSGTPDASGVTVTVNGTPATGLGLRPGLEHGHLRRPATSGRADQGHLQPQLRLIPGAFNADERRDAGAPGDGGPVWAPAGVCRLTLGEGGRYRRRPPVSRPTR
jgi:hypothetical protein